MKRHLLRTFLLVWLSCASNVYAVTLGQPRVNSFLGQPLEAEFDLEGLAPGQRRDLAVRIAGDRHFERLGIVHSALLDALIFDVVGSDGYWMVRARTRQAVTETYLDFPLQLSWPGGQLVQRYTLLLEPPARKRSTPARSKNLATRAVAHPATVEHGNIYGPIRGGEILTAVAQKLKPEGTTTWQMSIVLFRANPHAFTGGNINKLRVGSVLTIPGPDVIAKLDNPSAISEFAAETTRWLTPTATPVKIAQPPKSPISEASRRTGFEAKHPHEEHKPTGRNDAGEWSNEAQLHVAAGRHETDAHPGDQQGLYEQLLKTKKDVEAHRTTNDAVATRLARAEAQIAHMQRLVERKDAEIVAAQSEAAERLKTSERSQKAGPLVTGNMAPTTQPWHPRYLWLAGVGLGFMILSVLVLMRRRHYLLAEEEFAPERPEAGHNQVSAGTKIELSPPITCAVEREETLARPGEQATGAPIADISAVAAEATEPAPPAGMAAGEGISESDDASVEDETADSVNGQNFETRPRAVWVSDINDAELASWAAELHEGVEQAETQRAFNETIELQYDQPDDRPVRVDEDIPGLAAELDAPLSAEPAEHAPIPAPIELGSINDTDRDPGLNDAIDPVSATGEDQDFSLSLDLARAYLEIGDQEGAEEILKRALAGAPDPEPRRQMEELLTQIA